MDMRFAQDSVLALSFVFFFALFIPFSFVWRDGSRGVGDQGAPF